MNFSFPNEELRKLVPEEPKQVLPMTLRELKELQSFLNGYERQLFARVSALTPTVATRLVRAGFLPNRPLDWQKAANYAAAITRGEWQLNGEAVKLTVDVLPRLKSRDS